MTPLAAAAGVEVETLALVREGWRGRAAVARVPASRYSALALDVDRWLGPIERRTFDAFEYERRRTSYLLGRCAAKAALSALAAPVGVEAHTLDVVAGCFQQPVIRGAWPLPLGVSISHAMTVAYAVAFPDEHPMAIDVEEIDAARAEVMKTQLTPREIDALRTLGDSVTLTVVAWTAKEALSKALRCGMTVPFDLLEVHQLCGESDTFTGTFPSFAQYRFESRVRDGAVVTLVLPKKTVAIPEKQVTDVAATD